MKNIAPHLRFRRRQQLRPGLAPLEFVLWLPVLLFVMALMVNYGTSAAWRVRGEGVARDAVWRTRWPRNGADEPRPNKKTWPTNATVNVVADAAISAIDHPALNQPVVRGPLPYPFNVNNTLDPKQGEVKGIAEINRRYPLLPKLGEYNSGEIAQRLLERKWQNREMGIPMITRRIPVIYDLQWPSRNPWLQHIQTIMSQAHYPDLSVLENDADWNKYEPYHHMGRAPDFHPRINPNVCSADRNLVYKQEVQRIVDVKIQSGQWQLGQISLLPRRLTSAFLSMYQATENEMQQLLMDPTTPPAIIAFINQELPYIQTCIQQLQQFQPQIGPFENGLRTRP